MSSDHRKGAEQSDRWSVEARKEDVYWLCECGVARKTADKIEKHTEKKKHFAEKVDKNEGKVIAFLAGGLDYDKYNTGLPNTAQIKREKNKNNPLFPRN